MKLLLLLLITVPVQYQNWSSGDIYIHRTAYLIDCQQHGKLEPCITEMRAEGMSERDIRLARRDVRNAVRK